MAKKKDYLWTGDGGAVQNPFSVLAGLKSAPVEKTPEDLPCTRTVRIPKVKNARVDRKGRGGKTVTVVAFHGMPDEAQRMAWLRFAKRQLGIGGALEGDGVILQGDQISRLDALKNT